MALILSVAAAAALFCRWLKQPVVLGYLVAGIFVGPHFSFFPSIVDHSSVKSWAEIGVIFLLFSIGLEFSFKKLMNVGGSALTIASLETAVMFFAGYTLARSIGWRPLESLYLGGMISISSTAIIYRTLTELNLKQKKFSKLVLGVLVIEDLVAVLLIVLLTTLTVSKQLEGGELIESVLSLGFFLTIWIVMGTFFLPSFLRFTRSFLNAETLVILGVGLCLAMVLIASKAGFSPALGAFVMGSLLSETLEGPRIEQLVAPVRDLFSAVFFVSIGMLLDPSIAVTHWKLILVISAAVLTLKPLASFVGGLIAGQSVRTSFGAALCLSQIGEFSFIIASLGIRSKVLRPEIPAVAIFVSIVTSFMTPYWLRLSDPLTDRFEASLKPSWREALKRYASQLERVQGESQWRDLLRAHAVQSFMHTTLSLALILGGRNLFLPFLVSGLGLSPRIAQLAGGMTTLFLAAPFLWALAMGRPRPEVEQALVRKRQYRWIVFLLHLVRIGLSLGLLAFMVTQFASFTWGLFFVVSLGVLAFLSRRLDRGYRWFEARFLTNWESGETAGMTDVSGAAPIEKLTPWDAHLSEYLIPPHHPEAGETLEAMKMREKFGVSVALIERGIRRIMAPSRKERLFPGDKVFVIGTDEAIAKFQAWVELGHHEERTLEITNEQYKLTPLRIAPESKFVGATIAESQFRERAGGLVVGIERGSDRILNPDSKFALQAGDLVWIVADKKRLKELRGV